MMRKVDFVAAAIANNTDLISPETRVILDGLDLAAAHAQGTLVDALSAELERLDRRLTPEQIVQVISEFKEIIARDLRQGSIRRSGFASSTVMEGWQDGMPLSPYFDGTLFGGAEAAAQVEGAPGLDPQFEDPGGGTLASPESLGKPPPWGNRFCS